MSCEVISRDNGGPNLIPSFRVNVYVNPSSEISGKSGIRPKLAIDMEIDFRDLRTALLEEISLEDIG